MLTVYYIQYVLYYKNNNPSEPIFDILDNLFFTSYENAEQYAKNENLKEYIIEELENGD